MNMPTINELAKQYADKVIKALREDGFIGRTYIAESELRDSTSLQVLKSLNKEIESLVYLSTGEPLSRDDKGKIIREASRLLHLQETEGFGQIIKAASNDALVDLLNKVEEILKGNK
jgi:hypothetical protein